jgi:hypothetical protein
MALQSSGQISLSNIASEKGLSLSDVSLNTLSTSDINQNSAVYPDGSQPHSISEFYGYDHLAGASGGPNVGSLDLFGYFYDPGEACTFGPEMPPTTFFYDADGYDGRENTKLFMDDTLNEPYVFEPFVFWWYGDGNEYYLIGESGAVIQIKRC